MDRLLSLCVVHFCRVLSVVRRHLSTIAIVRHPAWPRSAPSPRTHHPHHSCCSFRPRHWNPPLGIRCDSAYANAPAEASVAAEGLTHPLMGDVFPAPAVSLAQALALDFALQEAFGSKVC